MSVPSVSIGEVAAVNPRFEKAGRPGPGDPVSFVPMAAVSEKTVSIVEANDRPYEEVAKGYTAFKRGDVLIAKITPCFENGKMALADNLPRELGFGSTEFHVIRASEKIDARYLFNLLRNPYVRRAGQMKMKGAAGQRRVPADFFSGLKIPLPPLEEQKRIAKILDAADALRAKRCESLAHVDALLQSTFLDLFGDPAVNPKGWPMSPIGDLCKVGTGSTPSRSSESNFSGSIPWVKSTEVDWCVIFDTSEMVSETGIKNARLKIFPKDSVVVALYGQGKTRGKCAVLGIDATMNQACAGIYPSEHVLKEYIFYILKLSYLRLRGEARGGNQENLNLSLVKSFEIPVPPLSLQEQFSRSVEVVNRQRALFADYERELADLFSSLQIRAFSGEL